MAQADKSAVIRVLRGISLLLQLKGENAFKSRAYDIASDRISGLTEDLATLVEQKRLTTVPGIGDALAEKITELVTTGQLAYHQQLVAQFPPGVFELVRVPDLGPRKVQALWKELGIGDLAALEAACREQRVRVLKGFGPKTEEKILAGIELLKRNQATERRRIAEAMPFAELLLNAVRAAPGVARAEIGGSLRRCCETVSDVDLIAAAPEVGPVFAAFRAHPEVKEVIAEGESKCSVRLSRGDLQVDLRVLPEADFATALHHFTGSKAHHIRLRGLAQDRGLKISEWGVFRGEEKLPVHDEPELYRLLGMQYVPPELREDAGEVEAALEGRLPVDLLVERDVAGNIHSHSTWSDGKNSLEQMALAARELGFTYLTVTDHSQTAGYAGGLKEDDLRRQWDEIDQVSEKVKGIRLLKGIESDILEDGSLDYPDKVLEKLDVVIGSIHMRYRLDEDGMTRRVLAAFDNPHFHIWGHPTGRLIQKREPAPLRMEEILDKAAKKGITLEVNGNPERLDLSAEHVKMALARNIKLVVSTDAHSIRELGHHLTFAVATARKGWARRADVLNTLPAEPFVQALRAGRA